MKIGAFAAWGVAGIFVLVILCSFKSFRISLAIIEVKVIPKYLGFS
jgi:hypothetical protein